jgi:hypothetical protein
VIQPPSEISLVACKLDLEDLDLFIDPQTKLPLQNPLVPMKTDTESTTQMPLDLVPPEDSTFLPNDEVISIQVRLQSIH